MFNFTQGIPVVVGKKVAVSLLG